MPGAVHFSSALCLYSSYPNLCLCLISCVCFPLYDDSVLLDHKLCDYPEVMEFCQDLYSKQIRSPFLIACMIDCYEEKLEDGKVDDNLQKALQVRF